MKRARACASGSARSIAAQSARLYIAGNGAVVRRHAIGKIEHDFVDVTPAPAFRRIVAFDDGMARRMEVFGGVAVRRIIATPDMSAGSAEPQMHPGRTSLQALLAAKRTRRHITNPRHMSATCTHRPSRPPVFGN